MADEGQVIGIHEVKDFDDIVKKGNESDRLIVVDFTASWCPPCRFIAPIFVELAKQNVSAIFLKVDVDELKEIAEKYEITGMPTFVFLKGGAEVHRIVGADKVELGKKVLELNVGKKVLELNAAAAASSTA